MLNHIHIKNFAIIEELSMELDNGLTVVTGETGAGKSIMIDAIGLVLGDRAEQGIVRQGAERAEISLTLALDENPSLQNWLIEHDLESEDVCLLRRVITAEGKSRAYINGSPSTLTLLRELAQQFVNIHGQHAHQLLQTAKTQRAILDDFAGINEPLSKLAEAHKEYHSINQRLTALQDADSEAQAKIDLLTFQLGELNELSPGQNEAQELEQEQSVLAHADLLTHTALTGVQTLYENDEANVHSQLSRVVTSLEEASQHDERFSACKDLVNSALIQIDESVDLLRHINDSIDADPTRLDAVDNRLGAFHSLARKHRISPGELPERQSQLAAELEQLQSSELSQEELEAALEKSREHYVKLANQVSKVRRKAANEISKQISATMQDLGMSGATFTIHMETVPDKHWKPWGTDHIEFRVAANPGQTGGSLAKVASGGELSRISLAITLLASQHSTLPTMIFDEVDTGIGGGIAEVVGQKLRQLGEKAQVFCVTHLPQVAAQGHQHLQVSKNKTRHQTETNIVALTEVQRVEEIARMLGGIELTSTTRQHAQEMLTRAKHVE